MLNRNRKKTQDPRQPGLNLLMHFSGWLSFLPFKMSDDHCPPQGKGIPRGHSPPLTKCPKSYSFPQFSFCGPTVNWKKNKLGFDHVCWIHHCDCQILGFTCISSHVGLFLKSSIYTTQAPIQFDKHQPLLVKDSNPLKTKTASAWFVDGCWTQGCKFDIQYEPDDQMSRCLRLSFIHWHIWWLNIHCKKYIKTPV